MAHCTSEGCRRWRPDWLLARTHGLFVDGAWYCSAACVESAAGERFQQDTIPDDPDAQQPSARLGSILLQQGSVTPRELADALEAQRSSGLRLGAQLRASGIISRAALRRALSAQSGVRHLATVDTSLLRRAVCGVTPAQVQALGIVPLRDDEDSLLVACAAPLPNTALRALQALSGREIEPFLVDDEDFAALAAAYARVAGEPPGAGMAANVRDGAARIAAFVAEAGAVSITRVVTYPFTWIRLAGTDRTATLLLPRAGRLEDSEWLVATTQP
jgi:hypothetical protein